MTTIAETPVATSNAKRTPTPIARYGRMWARVPRELGFLLPVLPIVIISCTLLSTVFFTGLGMIVLVIGIFVLMASFWMARGFGWFELLRLRAGGQRPITAPSWRPRITRGGWLGRLVSPLADGNYWLYLLHGMIVAPIVGTVTWAITISWGATALGGLSFWFWSGFIPRHDTEWYMSQALTDLIWPNNTMVFDGRSADVLLYAVFGVICAITLPFITRAMIAAHQGMARGMLAAFPSDSLVEQVADLSASRSAAVAAEGTALRRLERDIHDGPQQRLVRLQMDLAAADRQLDQDPDAARALLSEALTQSQEALDELRALSRGFAPPILLDRGLVAALESLADRSPIPTRVVAELPAGLVLPAEWERNAYFIAAEALTNAVKHSAATTIEVRVGVVPDVVGQRLDVTVTDDGQGGATQTPGHGISGLDERLHGLGGTLDLSSPAGGPTVVAAHLPLPA